MFKMHLNNNNKTRHQITFAYNLKRQRYLQAMNLIIFTLIPMTLRWHTVEVQNIKTSCIMILQYMVHKST